ncbi:MAG TPA: hypothetical protein VFZ38_10655 [Vicinamibacterales bacterium]
MDMRQIEIASDLSLARDINQYLDRVDGPGIKAAARLRAAKKLDRDSRRPARNQEVRVLLAEILSELTDTDIDDIADSLSWTLGMGMPAQDAVIGQVISRHVMNALGVEE